MKRRDALISVLNDFFDLFAPNRIVKFELNSLSLSFIRFRRAAFPFALFAMLGTTSGCGEGPVTFRYRLTLDVFCDGELHSGSGVIQISSWISPTLSGTMAQGNVVGQAVMVDLGQRGILFALLRGPDREDNGLKNDAESLPLMALRDRIGVNQNYLDDWRAAKSMRGTEGELRIDQLPMLAMFDDVDDPSTIKQIDPAHLEKFLGSGAHVKSATVQIVDSPISEGLETKLKWLDRIKGHYLDGDTFPHRSSVNSSYFRQGY